MSENNSLINKGKPKCFDQTYILADSLMKLDWKVMPNETREIAGLFVEKHRLLFLTVFTYLLLYG
jgi:hypothetical protein